MAEVCAPSYVHLYIAQLTLVSGFSAGGHNYVYACQSQEGWAQCRRHEFKSSSYNYMYCDIIFKTIIRSSYNHETSVINVYCPTSSLCLQLRGDTMMSQ
jgi:hypothetical protein